MKKIRSKLLAMNKLLFLTLLPLWACAGSKVIPISGNTSTPDTQKTNNQIQENPPPNTNRPIECLHPFGENPEDSLDMLRTFSLYQEGFKYKQYSNVYPMWQKIMEKAPCARLGPYVDAETFFPVFLADSTLKNKREILLDSFLWVFPQRIKYHGNEGAVKGRLAYYTNLYRPAEFQKVIELCERAIQIEQNKLEYIVPSTYMAAVFNAFRNKKASKEDILNAYDKIGNIMDFNVKANGPYVTYWKQTQDGIENSLRGIVKGEDIDQIFLPRLKANPNDTALQEKMVKLYRSAQAYTNPNYIAVLKSLFEKRPDAQIAEELAKYYENNNEIKLANQYYDKAADYYEDPKQKETIYIRIASNYLKINSPSQAISYANKALSLNSSNGFALIIEAMAKYSIGVSNCDDPFDKKAAAWVAIDMLQRAITIDPSIRDEAQNRINTYKKHAPNKETAFFKGITEGQTYNINCMNASTTVRFFE
ncbi:MAG: hypothetical protein J5I91_03060 [Bacteroidetes bacterium]|nr:hypothetical protein [Bacteroidota bacterium]